MTADIRVGDVGTELVVQFVDELGVPIDVSAASVRQIKLKRRGIDVAVIDAALDTTGADGRVKHVSDEDTFTVSGRYQIQGYAEVGGAKFHTAIAGFDVLPHL